MRNTLAIVGCSLLLVACGGEKSENEKYYDKDYKPEETEAATGAAAQPEASADTGANTATEGAVAANSQSFEQGAKLISFSDCLSCHRENEKLIGPAYTDVAHKYEFNDKNIDYLAGKIIEGGAGVWGQVAMTPHPDLSREDAREMAKYVLSLRKK